MVEDFEEPVRLGQMPAPMSSDDLVVDVAGYEGPIDLLLSMARNQKVDLTQISILELADQYLEWVARVRQTNLELAADYLVMAAWLAYLKSRLLLPDLANEEEPTGEEMAEALSFQLRRLESMQDRGSRLVDRPRLGQDFFPRGAPEAFAVVSHSEFDLELYDLLKAYGDQTRRVQITSLRIDPSDLMSPDDALHRLSGMLGGMRDWMSIEQFLPANLRSDVYRRSALASTLAAALQLAKEGKLKIRQDQSFGPIQFRQAVDIQPSAANEVQP
ncbi:MAG: ScpA family protein [Proteobacteria bacterium]|nr:ScpA family protein [Pseudomonadota bacterium]